MLFIIIIIIIIKHWKSRIRKLAKTMKSL